MGRPEQIAQEEPAWWWNPLSYVTDEEKVYKLTQHFAVGSRTPGSKPDAYFDPKAEDTLSSYFLAAALADLPITQVYMLVTEQVSRAPPGPENASSSNWRWSPPRKFGRLVLQGRPVFIEVMRRLDSREMSSGRPSGQ